MAFPAFGSMMKLTEDKVRRIPLPGGKLDHIEWDDEVPRFGLRIRAGGSRSYVVQYELGAKQRRLSLGSTKLLTADKARKKARDILAMVRLGKDPAGEKETARAQATETFEAVTKLFLAAGKERWKPRTYGEIERHLLKQCKPLHRLIADKIDRRTIATTLSTIANNSGNVAADRARASLSMFYSWCMRQGIVANNPVNGTERRGAGNARERVLNDDELREIWEALPDSDYGNIVKLLILTGQRREEIGSLRRSEIDFDKALITLSGERTKNRRPHQIPLSDAALAVLRQQFKARDESSDLFFGRRETGYAGWSKSKKELDDLIYSARLNRSDNAKPMEPWVLHDLRRTVATRMADLGVLPHVIEAVLNHVSGHKASVAGIYNRATYAAAKAAAMVQWAEHVSASVEDRHALVRVLESAYGEE